MYQSTPQHSGLLSVHMVSLRHIWKYFFKRMWACLFTRCILYPQLAYAARDAYVGVFVFWRLVSCKLRAAAFFSDVSVDSWSKALSFCQGLLDVDHKAVNKRPTDGHRRPQQVLGTYDLSFYGWISQTINIQVYTQITCTCMV